MLSELSTRIVQSDKFLTSHRAQTSSKNYRVLALETTWDIVHLYRQCIVGIPSVVSKMYSRLCLNTLNGSSGSPSTVDGVRVSFPLLVSSNMVLCGSKSHPSTTGPSTPSSLYTGSYVLSQCIQNFLSLHFKG